MKIKKEEIMMNQKYEKEYCMVCGNINPQDREICECGGRNFIYGNNFTYENKKVICNCSNDQFKMTFHMNMNPIYTKKIISVMSVGM